MTTKHWCTLACNQEKEQLSLTRDRFATAGTTLATRTLKRSFCQSHVRNKTRFRRPRQSPRRRRPNATPCLLKRRRTPHRRLQGSRSPLPPVLRWKDTQGRFTKSSPPPRKLRFSRTCVSVACSSRSVKCIISIASPMSMESASRERQAQTHLVLGGSGSLPS